MCSHSIFLGIDYDWYNYNAHYNNFLKRNWFCSVCLSINLFAVTFCFYLISYNLFDIFVADTSYFTWALAFLDLFCFPTCGFKLKNRESLMSNLFSLRILGDTGHRCFIQEKNIRQLMQMTPFDFGAKGFKVKITGVNKCYTSFSFFVFEAVYHRDFIFYRGLKVTGFNKCGIGFCLISYEQLFTRILYLKG